MNMKKCLNLEYDVVLSFAGEDRDYVEKTASFLRKSGIKVFYDLYEDIDLWGKDLYQHLDDVYQNKAKYAVVFISEHYKRKLWTNHELKSAQARAFSESEEYILPARFDDTEIPGIRKTIGYVSLIDLTPINFAKKIIKKLGDIEPEKFLPDDITYIKELFNSLFEDFEEEEIESIVLYIFNKLKLTTDRERQFLTALVMHSCRHDITEDLHEDFSLFERVTGFNREELIDILKSLTNLGFEYSITKSGSECHDNGVEHAYEHLSVKMISREPELVLVNVTMVLVFMYFGAMNGKCEICCMDTLQRLDFSDLKDNLDDEDLEFIIRCIP
ncbi:TIR domain-containing protein [Tenacibaculum tangerinum]|uniref:TIR domain-containing protein n=1 Tax=Tenacibaculum tangerinum TaxID=3038772 RepID=A0ABY8L5V4_9FLAO|nr:TIR domain-containing protein [Tenacibaculum tangerinum]WGH75753.1 TIR domain-containing protein [Tenacibaculum tangerinum]